MDEKENMTQETMEPVPYLVHESMLARQDLIIKRLWITVILLIVLLVGTNAGWIVYESQFEDVVVTQDVDTGEGDAVIAGVGDVNYGESTPNG